ncbi:MAG: T9SS type A sorting domain-containing protein [Bacteroidota bacterium]|nr:T9SS type A sorting domain-containing protein [Bacteroidota bacterium]
MNRSLYEWDSSINWSGKTYQEWHYYQQSWKNKYRADTIYNPDWRVYKKNHKYWLTSEQVWKTLYYYENDYTYYPNNKLKRKVEQNELANPYDDKRFEYYYGDYTVQIDEPQASAKLHIYPNPAREFITINGFEEIRNPMVKIYDIQGNLVFKKELSANNNKVKLPDISNGIYLLKITGSGNKVAKASRLVKL